MAVTLANIKRNVKGNKRVVSFDVTGPASYTTGGEALTLAQQQQLMAGDEGKISAVDATKFTSFESESDASGRRAVLDRANGKVLFFDADSEIPALTNLSAVTVKCSAEFGGQDL